MDEEYKEAPDWLGRVPVVKKRIVRPKLNYRDTRWWIKLGKIAALVRKHDRLPRYSVDNETSCNLFLARATANLKNGKLPPKLRERFLTFREEFKHLIDKSQKEMWIPRLHKIAAFIDENNRLPEHSEIEERKDYKYLMTAIRSFRRGKMSQERTSQFKVFIERYRKYLMWYLLKK